MKKRIKEIFKDPVKFCTYVLGFKPTKYQEDLARKFVKHQFITARWCRQSGKSHMISALLLWYALTHPGSYIAVVGPSWRQTKLIIRKINGFLTKLPKSWYVKPRKTIVELKNGSRIECFPNNPDTIRGPTLDVVYMDEANFIPNDEEMLRVLEDLGFKRYLLTSVEYNLERLKDLTDDEMRRVKDALTATGQYKRLMSTRKAYPRKEEFRRWIETQSLEVIAKVLSRLAVLAETKVYLFWNREAST